MLHKMVFDFLKHLGLVLSVKCRDNKNHITKIDYSTTNSGSIYHAFRMSVY